MPVPRTSLEPPESCPGAELEGLPCYSGNVWQVAGMVVVRPGFDGGRLGRGYVVPAWTRRADFDWATMRALELIRLRFTGGRQTSPESPTMTERRFESPRDVLGRKDPLGDQTARPERFLSAFVSPSSGSTIDLSS